MPEPKGPELCTSSYGSIRSDGTGDGTDRRLMLAASNDGIALEIGRGDQNHGSATSTAAGAELLGRRTCQSQEQGAQWWKHRGRTCYTQADSH